MIAYFIAIGYLIRLVRSIKVRAECKFEKQHEEMLKQLYEMVRELYERRKQTI